MKRTFENFDNDCHEKHKLTEGHNDDAVYHHSELNIMKKIRNDLCCEHLIRGDECFGFGDIARSDQETLSRVGNYSLLDFPAIKNLINEDCLSDFIQASNQNIQNILNSTDLTDYADRKDFFYFHQRLINYLNRSSYYKMCILEFSNPWLDKDILSFLCKIPRKYRYNKILYKKTVSYMFPDLYNIPFAKKHSLEDWNTLIKNDKSLSFKINTKLKKSIALEAIININNLQQLLDSFYNNSQFSHNSLKSIILKYGKYFASHIPLLYSYAKKHFMKYNIGRDIVYSKLIMRL
ncbi:MAG: hypothetical protein ACOCQD_05150 [archaeon]